MNPTLARPAASILDPLHRRTSLSIPKPPLTTHYPRLGFQPSTTFTAQPTSSQPPITLPPYPIYTQYSLPLLLPHARVTTFISNVLRTSTTIKNN